jgi:hypothetical protein
MTWRLAAAGVAALAFVIAPAPAFGACAGVPGNLVGNCSFEQPAGSPGSVQVFGPGGSIGAWTVSAGGDRVDLVEKSFGGGYPVFDGNQALDLNRDNPGAVEQRLATTAGVTYHVSVHVSGFVAAKSGCSATEPEQLRISAGSASQDFSFQPDDAANPPGNQRFELRTVDFVAAGNDLLKLAGLNAGCTGPIVDDVVVAQAAAAPVTGKSMTAEVVSGTVLARAPGARAFTAITSAASLAVGTIVDARRGRVRITAMIGGRRYSADFYGGLFQIAQLATRRATADMKLFGGSFRGCPKAPRAAKKRKPIRQLWGDGSGPFRTIGRFSAAVVRGTAWLTQDTCSGTLTVVTTGSVTVRDFVKRRNVIVRAGHRYLAAARRR